ncbi:hypothetical protein [Pseudomonas sp. 24 E 13]|nr:hypothetical protein [Pseudomonas sp. 24 E 13]
MTRVEALLQRRQGIVARGLDPLDRQGCLAQHHLHRFIQAFPEDRGAQDVVALDHAVQRLDKPVHRRLVSETELHLQHVGVALCGCQVMVENPGLQRRQAIDVLHIGDAAGYRLDDVVDGGLVEVDQGQHVRGDGRAVFFNEIGRHLHFVVPADRRRQCRQGRLAEQHAHIGAQVYLAHALDQLDRQQRVAAELEEIILAPHAVDLEQVLPERGDGGFHHALGRCITAPGQRVGIRCGQGLAVEFAVGGQREPLQQHKGSGHHVIGQALQQMVAQGGRSGRAVGNYVGHQAFVAGGVLPGNHHGVAHAVGGGQVGLDFTQFDTETADLHLVVVAPQVLDAAVGRQAAKVAGLVHAQAGGRVVQEAFGVERVTVQITARHPGAAHIQLTDHTERQRLALCVKDVQLQVRNAHANRAYADQLRIGRFQRAVGHVHGGFGDAVHVHQLRTGIHRPCIPGFEHARFQRLAAENHLAQGMRLVAVALGRDQLAERTRRLVEDADRGFAEQRVALIR